MVTLLVALSVMAVMMTAAMPVWKQMSRREKEAELVFRGEQYARAIGLFQRKNGPGTLPPTVDVLVEGRFLRKKYKDPITNDDFAPILITAGPQGGVAQPGAAVPGGGRGDAQAVGGQSPPGLNRLTTPPTGRGAQPGAAVGGISGVTSKSKETSLRLYNGRSHYNEWQFVYTPPALAPGTAAPGAPGTAGQRGRGGLQAPGNPFAPGLRGMPGGVGPGVTPGGAGSGMPAGPIGPAVPTPTVEQPGR